MTASRRPAGCRAGQLLASVWQEARSGVGEGAVRFRLFLLAHDPTGTSFKCGPPPPPRPGACRPGGLRIAAARSVKSRAPERKDVLPRGFRSADLPLTIRFASRRATLRRLGPDDAGRLLEFFATHTPETVHLRYGYLFTQMSPERARELVSVDQSRDAALGVFEEDAEKDDSRLIAIGRYCLAGDARSAEAAFVVREDRRGRGIATALLEALAAIARERGLVALTAEVQRDNHAMIGVFLRQGAKVAPIAGTNGVEAVLRL